MRHALALAALLLAACSAGATAQPGPATENTAMQMRFDSPAAVQPWRAVNDGVMGGRSSGGPDFNGDALVFSGAINTNGGGFSSIRHPLTPGDLRGADGIALRVKSDGRPYRLTFRTSQSWRGRNVSWQIPIPQTEPGEWADVFAPFADAEASVFGRSVNAGTFDPVDAREVGIILADGQDGPFRLEVAQMEAVEAR